MGRAQSRLSAFTLCVQLGLLHFHANLHVLGTEFQRPFDEVRTASSKVLIRHEQEVMS